MTAPDVTGTALLVAATRALRAAGVDDPARDARVLLAHVLGVDRGRLTLVLPDDVSAPVQSAYQAAITARADRQPVSQITGKREFYGREFIVTSDVLDPRPETELLVQTALENPFASVLDLGTGTGCILLTLLAENQSASGVGTDVSTKALAVCERNAAALDLGKRCITLQGSWFEPVGNGRFDLIVSNPPYITDAEMTELSPEVRIWEPHLALTPGGDGLDAYREITAKAQNHLSPNGRLMVEIGAGQGADVFALFTAAGFQDVRILKDLSGHDRVVCGMLPSGHE